MTVLAKKTIKRIHCMGIGGIGVSGLAQILQHQGYQVTGSDIKETLLTKQLQKVGIEVFIDHNITHVRNADLVVYSSAIQKQNPEFLAALDAGIPMVHRGELLAELMQEKRGIAVSGTHGKTTTSSLIGYTMLEGELDPIVYVGGILNHMKTNVHVGQGEYFVAEVDESDASFLHVHPHIAVVTNIDADHLEAYEGDFKQLQSCFLRFLNQIPQDGVAVVGIDDPVVRDLVPHIQCPVVTFGFDKQADFRIENFKQEGLMSHFNIIRPDLETLAVSLSLPGRHNVLNAAATIAVASQVGVQDQHLLPALKHFPGIGRRFYSHGEIQINKGKALIFDDYGHHPCEVEATLQAARAAWPKRRIVLVFQPHRYTRTRDLMKEFAKTLSVPDVLVLLDVYSAGEVHMEEANGVALCHAITDLNKISPTFVPDMETLPTVLKTVLRDDDVVLFQGAGSIGPMAAKIVANW